MKEFFTRTLTGAAFVIVMLLAVWWNIYSLTFLLLIIAFLALSELLNLKGIPDSKTTRLPLKTAGIIIIAASSCLAAGFIPTSVFLVMVLSSILLTLIFVGISRMFSVHNLIVIFSAFLYIIFPLSLVPFLAYSSFPGTYQPGLIISTLIIIWVFDSFAYLTGITLGKHKMFPSISPKKSWEGFFGGIAFALLAGYLISTMNEIFTAPQWLIISLIIAISGTAGDFYESYLKRNSRVKDSGNWLPGHGGILDRFDSFLFAVPLVFIYLKILT